MIYLKRATLVVRMILFIFFLAATFVSCKSPTNKGYNYRKANEYTETLKRKFETNELVRAEDVFDFKWDTAYVIKESYMGGDQLDQIIGLDLNLEEPLNDMTRRIIFINDKQLAFEFRYGASLFKGGDDHVCCRRGF